MTYTAPCSIRSGPSWLRHCRTEIPWIWEGLIAEEAVTLLSAPEKTGNSTLLALFLSAALMLVQTLVHRRSEDLLARIDRWVVDHVLPRAGSEAEHPLAAGVSEALAPHLEAMRRDLMAAMEPATRALQELSSRMGEGLGPHVDRFAESVDRLPTALSGLHQGAQAMSRLGDEFVPLFPPRGSVAAGVQAAVPAALVSAALHHVPARELADLEVDEAAFQRA